MELLRIIEKDGSLAELEAQWSAQCVAENEDYDVFSKPNMDLVRTVCKEDPPDNNYGIYSLREPQSGTYLCLMHINRAELPKTTGTTLRVLWVVLCPKIDFGEFDATVIAAISAAIVIRALELSKKEMKTDQLKVHLGNISDRRYFVGFCDALSNGEAVKEAVIRGNWLHLSP